MRAGRDTIRRRCARRRFPQERHTYAISDDELEHFQRLVEAGSPLGAEDEGGVL
jgi:hypothetical protein